ncbi:BgTH12-04002 [Blumeria graminis f. sp. triticale]|uniref:BgTH12-04001 n=1 Tax=Blumeria graminis f. sp. triticale TaxID=1689686 RepID=A0A9W4GCP6_BLUGR|nr:BgTH12-04001 [Blumeria graminis f. sp. triticale]CAD6499897.1 BgTH12-04002 [Blumeria graminis f. sp. triticale]
MSNITEDEGRFNDARKDQKTLSCLKEIGLPQTATKFIDIDLVGEPLILTKATPIELNTKIFDFMMNNQSTVDKELLFDFQEEFGEWNKLEYNKTSPVLKKRLRTFLREHGLYPGPLKRHIVPQLIGFLGIDELPDWDYEELRAMTDIHHKSLVHYSRYQTLSALNLIPSSIQDQKVPIINTTATKLPPTIQAGQRLIQNQSRTVHPTTYQFQRAPTQIGIMPNDLMNPQIPIKNEMDLDDVTNVLAYQTVPPLIFLSQEPEPNTVTAFKQ